MEEALNYTISEQCVGDKQFCLNANEIIRSVFSVILMNPSKMALTPYNLKQEVSSKKIIVEANRHLLSLKKDSGKVNGPNDLRQGCNDSMGWGEMTYKFGPKPQKMGPK